MEIDPEVAELLGDLPSIKLPIELEAAGWGHHTMTQMIQYGQERPRAPTEGEHQPTYDETCCQCGRPVTLHREEWTDHRGKTWCDRELLSQGDFVVNRHVTEREYNLLARMPKGAAATPPIAAHAAKKFKDLRKKEVTCSKTKYSNGCTHACLHPSAHFGFHECRFCRHIWGP